MFADPNASTQLPLMLSLPVYAGWSHIYAGPNQQAVEQLKRFSDRIGDTSIFLAGVLGAGKTLLLQTVCQEALNHGHQSMYLSLSSGPAFHPGVLENLEQFQVLCLDDVHTVVGDPEWERALFNLYNAMAAAGHALLLAADNVPDQLTIALPDLSSRWKASLLLTLKRLSEAECLAALHHVANCVGLSLNQEVEQFLLRRIPRDIASIMQVLDQLNQASYIEKRAVTLPFVKKVLNL